MRSLCPLIVLVLAITTPADAQVVQVVPPGTYVAPAPVYASPTTTYYAGTTYPYVTRPYATRYGYVPSTYVPSATVAPSYPYRTWVAPRPIYHGALRPVIRTYVW
jgi:hypothetical protein